MLGLGAFAFANPWLLLGLAALPAIWWLLRVTPPSPRRTIFPPLALLLQLQRTEETPAATPLWLMILRLLMAALAILALARPLLNPVAGGEAEGPLLLVVDDGWTAAADWEARRSLLADLLERAQRDGRPVQLLTTAPAADGRAAAAGPLGPPGTVGTAIAALQPKPWPSDRAAARAAVERLQPAADGEVAWLTDGLAHGEVQRFAAALAGWGDLTVYRPDADRRALALVPPDASAPTGLSFALVTAPSPAERRVQVRASTDEGRLTGRTAVVIPPGADRVDVAMDLPNELRNASTRLDLEGERSAGAVVLLDERWRRRPVGVHSGADVEQRTQPLLSNLYYLNRALTPYADLRQGAIDQLLERPLSVIMLADVGVLPPGDERRLAQWVEQGGVLVRFAGPRLARQADSLVPVRLRAGGRTLGGTLSWDTPQRLAAFPDAGPFQGMPTPTDVIVRHQVLAEPSLDLTARTWARLEDGTPLITGARQGAGWLVLFHTTANTDWSNLAISGSFVDMLRRVVGLARGVAGDQGDRPLAPLATFDGLGQLGPASPLALPIPAGQLEETAAGPRHPPGFYGAADARRALNLTAGLTGLTPLGPLDVPARQAGYAGGGETDLMPWLLVAAALLALADLVAVLALRGLLPAPRRAGTMAAALLLAAALLPQGAGRSLAQAAGDDSFALAATLETHLAYVLTGDDDVDALSEAGLAGLSVQLRRRTSIEPGEPMAVDPERDELLFFPLLYWPMTPAQAALSDEAVARLDDYLKTGGTILFDTRDANLSPGPGTTPAGQQLQQLLGRLDVPALLPVPAEHVLTKAFYLLDHFPGRHRDGEVWVEARPGNVNDGVSSIIIGANDWAAAWATDETGRPLAAVYPDGPRQRELAYRFGINLVMYTLTGNYKADQVHVPAILERLGQ